MGKRKRSSTSTVKPKRRKKVFYTGNNLTVMEGSDTLFVQPSSQLVKTLTGDGLGKHLENWKQKNEELKIVLRDALLFSGQKIADTRYGGCIMSHCIAGVELVSKQNPDTPAARDSIVAEIRWNAVLHEAQQQDGTFGDTVGLQYLATAESFFAVDGISYLLMEKGTDFHDMVKETSKECQTQRAEWRQELQRRDSNYTPGKSTSYSRTVPSPWEKTMKTHANQLAHGLCALSALGLSHGDVKTENIIYCESSNCIKVIDFDSVHNAVAQDNTRCGTRAFRSLESAEHAHYDSTANDIWCFGLVVFSMLTGTNAYSDLGDIYFRTLTTGRYTKYPMKSTDAKIVSQNKCSGLELYLHYREKLDLVTSSAINFLDMIFRPEADRCTWGQIITHPWFEECEPLI